MPAPSDEDMWAARLALLGLMARVDALPPETPIGKHLAAARLAATLAEAAAGAGKVALDSGPEHP